MIFEDAGDHAGEMETSMGLAHVPDGSPLPGRTAGHDGTSTRFEAVNRGWVEITRPWHLLTTNSARATRDPPPPPRGRH